MNTTRWLARSWLPTHSLQHMNTTSWFSCLGVLFSSPRETAAVRIDSAIGWHDVEGPGYGASTSGTVTVAQAPMPLIHGCAIQGARWEVRANHFRMKQLPAGSIAPNSTTASSRSMSAPTCSDGSCHCVWAMLQHEPYVLDFIWSIDDSRHARKQGNPGWQAVSFCKDKGALLPAESSIVGGTSKRSHHQLHMQISLAEIPPLVKGTRRGRSSANARVCLLMRWAHQISLM